MLITERRGVVLLITLNRPDKRNALHPDLIAALSETLAETATDATLNVVVLTGAGSAFCAGLDLEHILTVSPELKAARLASVFEIFRRLWTLPQPVIAAINGPAIAGGFDLAQFCDLRLCAPSAVFGQAEINLGLTQIMFPLYKIIGLSRAKELALTGAVISAAEAHRIGLVNHIYPADELLSAALRLAETLAAKPRTALFETKRLSRELIEMDTEAAFTRMGAAIQERLRSDEHQQTLNEYLARLKRRT